MVRPVSTSVKLILATVAITAGSGACTIFYPTVQVGPNFRVKIEDGAARSKAFEWRSEAAPIGLSQIPIRTASHFSMAFNPDTTISTPITMWESRMAPTLM
jgi:hypothetical protein